MVVVAMVVVATAAAAAAAAALLVVVMVVVLVVSRMIFCSSIRVVANRFQTWNLEPGWKSGKALVPKRTPSET